MRFGETSRAEEKTQPSSIVYWLKILFKGHHLSSASKELIDICSNDGSTHPSFINSSLHSSFIGCSDDRHFPIPWRCQKGKETKQTMTRYFTEKSGGKLQPLSKHLTENQENRRTYRSLTHSGHFQACAAVFSHVNSLLVPSRIYGIQQQKSQQFTLPSTWTLSYILP